MSNRRPSPRHATLEVSEHRLGLAARQVAAIARRDFQVEISYRFAQVNHFLMVAVGGFFMFYVSKLVNDPEELSAYDGGYFEYLVVGLAVANFTTLGLHTFSERIMREQRAGTLELLLAGPVRFTTILAGSMMVPLLWATFELVGLVGIGLGVIGSGLSVSAIAVALPVLFLMLFVFCGFGVLIAAIVILVKRGDPISGPLGQITLLFSGALFPVAVLPEALRYLAYVFPPYYGIRGVREALLADASIGDVTDEIAVLAVSAALLMATSMFFFRWAVREAKRIGVLHAS